MADPPRKRYKWYLSQKSPLKSVPRSSRHALQSRMMKNDTRRNILNISATAIDNSTASDTSDDEQDQNFFFEDAEDDELKVAGTENDKITEANAPDIEKENFTDEDESEFESLADENWQEDIEDEVVEEALVAASSTSDEGRPSYEDQSTANQREDQVVEDQPLYEGAPITMGTSILLLMTFAINHSLSGAALSDLLELIAVHCKKPNLCTKSVYKFKSLFRELRTPLHCHYYCTFCNGLLEGSNVNICPYCKKAVTNDKIFKKSHFIEVPIELQLQDFFLRKGFYDDLGYRFTRKKKNVDNIEDVQDGSEYQRHFGPGGLLQQQSNVALQFNTDGVAIFKSSAFKIWPVYIEILDLPPNKRTLEENLVFAGLWFGSKSPVMNTFLKPYMKSHLHLERKGIPVSLPDRRQMTCKAILLNGTFDLPARCMVCNMMQYNGLCGCGICEEPGETLKVGKGHSHVYPMSHEMAKNPNGHAVLRTKESTKINAQEALNSGSLVTGVKGPSMLSFLPNFDIIKGVPVDYMHGVLLGVTKNLLNYWFNPKYNQEDWYCGNKLSDVDKMLASITPPNEITRLPRSIEHHKKYWKASELRSWLFHYSVPIMSTVLKAPYLHHFMLLAKGVYSLCKDSISQEDLEESSVLLKTFVYYMDKLYGKQASTANVHNLLHLVRCVIWNGPLWAFSCFSYEDANGKLRKLFHGTQHIQLQIVAAVSLKIKMPALVQNIPVESEALAFYEKLAMNSSALSIKTWEFVSTGCYMIGVPKSKKLADTVALALREVLGIPISIGHFYQRAMISSKVFHSKSYTRAQKRNSFTVMFKKDDEIEYGHIESFVKVRNNSCQCNEPTKCLCKSWMYFALINKIILPDYHRFEETDGVLAVKIDHVIKAHHAVDGNLVAVQIHQILEKVVCMDMPGHEFLYLSRFPNLFEKD